MTVLEWVFCISPFCRACLFLQYWASTKVGRSILLMTCFNPQRQHPMARIPPRIIAPKSTVMISCNWRNVGPGQKIATGVCITSEEIVLYKVKRNNPASHKGWKNLGVNGFYSGEGNLSDENLKSDENTPHKMSKSDEVFIAETHERGSQGEVNHQRQNRRNKPMATAS